MHELERGPRLPAGVRLYTYFCAHSGAGGYCILDGRGAATWRSLEPTTHEGVALLALLAIELRQGIGAAIARLLAEHHVALQ